MIGVFVTFTFPHALDAAALRAIARQAVDRFTDLSGLRSKVFTLNESQRQATNFYIWEDEAVARSFFTSDFAERVARLYGAQPAISFVEIAALVDNARPARSA